MLVGMYVFPRFLVIKIFWRFFFLSWYIQTNQAYLSCLKTNNRDDYVSIYRLHGGSSVLMLNFVFSLPIYFIISLQHYICMINLVFGHVIIHVRIIFFVTASEVCKTPWEILQTPFFKDVISTLIELQGNDPAFVVSVPKCPLHIGNERTELWCRNSAKDDWGKDSGQWGEALTLKRREISQ